MSSIPDELYWEILLRVPVKSTFMCKCVCKTWCSIISNPDFAIFNLNLFTASENSSTSLIFQYRDFPDWNLYSISYHSLLSSKSEIEIFDNAVELNRPFESLDYYVELLGSCDGLVCLRFDSGYAYDKGFLCVWNPATGEYKELPKSPNEVSDDLVGIYAFGYDHKIDDYKLLKTVCTLQAHNKYLIDMKSLVDVYTLRSNLWKSIQTVPYRFAIGRVAGVLVNGALHWLGERKTGDENSFHTIISLDVSNERFEDIKLPKETLENNHVFLNVGLLEECLCVLTYACYERPISSKVWVMQDYGVQESWNKHYVIAHDLLTDGYCSRIMWHLRVMWSFENDEILLYTTDGLILYDLKHSSARKPIIKVSDVENYVESLVSLNSGSFVERKKCRRHDTNLNKRLKKNSMSICH